MLIILAGVVFEGTSAAINEVGSLKSDHPIWFNTLYLTRYFWPFSTGNVNIVARLCWLLLPTKSAK